VSFNLVELLTSVLGYDGLHLLPSSELCLDGKLAKKLEKWKRNFENFLIVINMVAQPKDADGNWPDGNTAV